MMREDLAVKVKRRIQCGEAQSSANKMRDRTQIGHGYNYWIEENAPELKVSNGPTYFARKKTLVGPTWPSPSACLLLKRLCLD